MEHILPSNKVQFPLLCDFDLSDSTDVMVVVRDCTRARRPELMKKKRKRLSQEKRKSCKMRVRFGTDYIVENKLCAEQSKYFMRSQHENDCHVCAINNVFADNVVTRENLFNIAEKMENTAPEVKLHCRDGGKTNCCVIMFCLKERNL